MLLILAVLCFAAAVLVHGAAFSAHTPWLSWEGLMLLGLLFLSLSAAFSGWPPAWPWSKRQ